MTTPTASSLFSLAGKRALITGSTRGLGLAMARGMAQAGASVVVNGRDLHRVTTTVESLRAEGLTEVRGAAFDVLDPAAVRVALDGLDTAIGGGIDVLVNNVGIHERALLETMELSAWRNVIEANLTSVFVVTQAVVGGMIDRRAGKIINICSLMSEIGRPGTGNYMAAKGGLKMLTKAMTVEWARYNIQANGIGPGYFATELTRPLQEDPKFDSWIRGRTPAGRWGRPEELVGTAVYLASAASDFVNGQILYVDGGILAAL